MPSNHCDAFPSDFAVRMPSPPSEIWKSRSVVAAGKIQDLADIIGEVVQATAAKPATFSVSITLPAGTPDDVVERVNAVLREVSQDLQVKRRENWS